jgi:hypothetical protein
LKPDIVTIYLGWNDIGQFHPFGLKYKNEKLNYRKRTFMGQLMEKLYILRLPYYFLGEIEKSKPIDKSPLTKNEIKILEEWE